MSMPFQMLAHQLGVWFNQPQDDLGSAVGAHLMQAPELMLASGAQCQGVLQGALQTSHKCTRN